MHYYKIILNSLPRISFAHVYETQHYRANFPRREGFLEITSVEKGDIIRTVEGRPAETLPAPRLLITFGHLQTKMETPAPLHRHETAGIFLSYEAFPLTPAQIVACAHEREHPGAPLFAIIKDSMPIDEYTLPLQKQLRRIIRARSVQKAAPLQNAAMVLDLLAEMTAVSFQNCLVEENRLSSPAAALYCRRAMNYIAAHLHEKIAVRDIAAHLAISTGYLSAIFRDYTGRSLIEYINHAKLSRVRELITDKRLSLREAGEQMGFTDPHYLSRSFRQYTGMTAREFARLSSSPEEH